jgi:hypothetical protein
MELPSRNRFLIETHATRKAWISARVRLNFLEERHGAGAAFSEMQR